MIWETVAEEAVEGTVGEPVYRPTLERAPVPGGWVYRTRTWVGEGFTPERRWPFVAAVCTGVALVFVPNPRGET